MSAIRSRFIGLNEAIASLDGIQRDLVTTRRDILTDLANVFERTADEKVHVITGKTKGSIRVTRVTDREAIIEAGGGAPYEEKRSGSKPPPHIGTGTGPHNFMTQAAKETDREAPSTIKKGFDSLLRKNRSNIR